MQRPDSSGVVGDGGRREINRGTWEARRGGLLAQRRVGKHNRVGGPGRESEGLIVARKRGNARGAKEPCRIHASVRGGGSRLDALHSTTGDVWDGPEPPLVDHRAALSPKLARLRQKLGRNAKQESQRRSRPSAGMTFYAHCQQLGLVTL